MKTYTEEERRQAMDVLNIKAKTDEQAEKEKWDAEKDRHGHPS